MASADRRDAKDSLFDAFASVAKALGSGRRAEIVDVLAQGERSVEDIAREIGQSVANTSHHLPHPGRCRAAAVPARRPAHHLPPHQPPGRRALGGLARRGRDPRRRGRGAGGRLPRRPRVRRRGDGRGAGHPARARPGGRPRRPPPGGVRRRPHRRRDVGPHRRLWPPPTSRSTARSSPTAAAPTASTPTTPCACSADRGYEARRLDTGYPEWRASRTAPSNTIQPRRSTA